METRTIEELIVSLVVPPIPHARLSANRIEEHRIPAKLGGMGSSSLRSSNPPDRSVEMGQERPICGGRAGSALPLKATKIAAPQRRGASVMCYQSAEVWCR